MNKPKYRLKTTNWNKILRVIALIFILGASLNLILTAVSRRQTEKLMNELRLEDDYYASFEAGGELEGRYAARGGFETASVKEDSGYETVGDIYVYYPKEAESSGEKYPLVVIGNPYKTPARTYLPLLDRLASWGFVVAACDDPESGNGDSISVTLDFVCLESSVKSFVDEERIGIAGYSLGGAGALGSATMHSNARKYKTIFTASAPYPLLAEQNAWYYDPSLLRIPYFMCATTGDDDDKKVQDIHAEYGGISPLSGLTEIYEAMPEDEAKLLARITGATHQDVLTRSDGYMTAWMMYWLQDDEEAGKAFFGEDAEILVNNNWMNVRKNR